MSDSTEVLRLAFLMRLTQDGTTKDRRRKDYHQAIFMPEVEGGMAIWSETDLDMVLHCFDKAVKDVESER
jgi:hypothetical protein